jgi:3' exoribonuclease, RNase T-like
MTTHLQVVVDIETLHKYDNAVITRIALTPFRFDEGLLTFDELVNRTFYISLDQEIQFNMGRVSGQETMDWWNTQSEELRIESFYPTDNDLDPRVALLEMKRFLKRWNYDHFHSFLWARNSGFECFKLQSLNEQLFPGVKQVLNPWNWHECKTFNHIMTGGDTSKWKPKDEESLGFQYHNAKHDAAMDAYRLICLWNGVHDNPEGDE